MVHRSAIIAGVRVDFMDAAATLRAIQRAAVDRSEMSVHFVNAYTIALADSDAGYRSILEVSDLNLPDGRPVAWAGRRILSQAGQLSGPDFMLHAFEVGTPLRHYLYGSTPETIKRLTANLIRSFPHAQVAGAESPPFRELTAVERRSLVERVSASGANIVWVGLGTPKQDYFVEEMKQDLRTPLVAVGAAFDFHAGLKPRPPRWIRAAGLEWAFRLVSEPRRLWRRYLFGNARFLLALLRKGMRPHVPGGSESNSSRDS